MRFFLIFSIFSVNFLNSDRISENVKSAVFEFCAGFEENQFCEDYSRLRGVRQTQISGKSNETLAEDVKSLENVAVKEEIGDVILQEGNVTSVLHEDEEEEMAPLSAAEIREELRKIIQEEYAANRLQVAKKPDDPACDKLRSEYDEVCFNTPPLAAFQETREFCLAFVKNCEHSLLTNIFTNVKSFKVDFTKYCKKHLERFQYVCPDPLRFFSFAQQAVEFCVRYKERCPTEEVPAEVKMFKKKDEGHIYTREIETWCTRQRRTVYNYCTEPDLLKVPKYMQFCGLYKLACIDIYQRVIYG
ncbi:unnamed protein product [Caenorhabditis angaria]|uniref:DUF19 domain-containing protein n=1 Tax=Caenorhabditis angaria TaxID=860376 RepID=A0A9P1IB88_9PELO|nr:unnamed protein product [Caenorhabditis angaria]